MANIKLDIKLVDFEEVKNIIDSTAKVLEENLYLKDLIRRIRFEGITHYINFEIDELLKEGD